MILTDFNLSFKLLIQIAGSNHDIFPLGYSYHRKEDHFIKKLYDPH